jgi:hypothetical protein
VEGWCNDRQVSRRPDPPVLISLTVDPAFESRCIDFRVHYFAGQETGQLASSNSDRLPDKSGSVPRGNEHSQRETKVKKHSRHCQDFSHVMGLILAIACTIAVAQTKQEHVQHAGKSVMPFDLAMTTHIFRMTEAGGVERVIVKDTTAKDQVTLIQQHLQHEAEAFQRGDYSDPASLHGADMPGLKDLKAGAARIAVSYSALPTDAEITFKTADLHLLTAIHRWFGAQLSEHGADAISE